MQAKKSAKQKPNHLKKRGNSYGLCSSIFERMEKDCWTTNFHAFRTHFIFQKHLSKKKMPSNEQTRPPPQQTNPSTIFYRVVFVVVKCVTMFLICQRLFVLLYNHCYHPYYYYYYCYKLHTTIKHCYAYIRRRRRDAQRSSTKRIPNPLAAFDENMRLKIVSDRTALSGVGLEICQGFCPHERGLWSMERSVFTSNSLSPCVDEILVHITMSAWRLSFSIHFVYYYYSIDVIII